MSLMDECRNAQLVTGPMISRVSPVFRTPNGGFRIGASAANDVLVGYLRVTNRYKDLRPGQMYPVIEGKTYNLYSIDEGTVHEEYVAGEFTPYAVPFELTFRPKIERHAILDDGDIDDIEDDDDERDWSIPCDCGERDCPECSIAPDDMEVGRMLGYDYDEDDDGDDL